MTRDLRTPSFSKRTFYKKHLTVAIFAQEVDAMLGLTILNSWMLIGRPELLHCQMTGFRKLTVQTFLDQEMLADRLVMVGNLLADHHVDQNRHDLDQFMDRLKDRHLQPFQNGFVEQLVKIIENKIANYYLYYCTVSLWLDAKFVFFWII